MRAQQRRCQRKGAALARSGLLSPPALKGLGMRRQQRRMKPTIQNRLIPPPTRVSHITCHPRLNQVRRHVQLPCRSL